MIAACNERALAGLAAGIVKGGRVVYAKGFGISDALRGVKDNPLYLNDERLLTLDDTVEFFNLVLGDN